MRTIIYKQSAKTVAIRRPASQTYTEVSLGLPPQTDGMSVILKPVAGRIFIRNATTNDYQELIALRQSGVDRLTLGNTHYAFSELPSA